MAGEGVPFPIGSDWKAWGSQLVTALRRSAGSVAETITQVIAPITEDREEALTELQAYAALVDGFISTASAEAQAYYSAYQDAVTANQPALAQTYLTQAVNTAGRTVSIGAEVATSESLDITAAYLNGTFADISDVRTAVANGDTALSQRITTVQAQANGNTSSITTITTATGTDANYALLANANGHIKAGFLLNSGVAGSNIVFIADKFIIANPSDSGDLKAFFVAGDVDGVSTVGLDGNLAITGSIGAYALNVVELSAITGNVGTLTAGVIQSTSGDMVIDLDNGTIDISI